ncbi:MAG TPA: SpoIID/LytB domain-containing protein [Acidimicrobiales bacterium]|nr:SpoIID/LytB domain-containing protein [Acidimicrobiales bacterium]
MTPPPTTGFRRGVAALAATALLLLTGLAAAPPAAAQEGPTTMTFNGRGWGHGRGMSQYGAQGAATNAGWTYRQILDHYYGGTTLGTRPDRQMRVRLIAQDAKPATVAIDSGTVRLEGDKGLAESGLQAVRLTKQADGTLKVERSGTCAGPWTVVNNGGQSEIKVVRESGDQPLRLCRPDGLSVWYPGEITSLVDASGTQRTVNTTSMESILRGIVPRESPASWHAEALKAQSVAARSYALAGDTRHLPYADTCDTTLCQVYSGWFQQPAGGSKTAMTDPRTDAAVTATAGQVRVHSSGAIARTEFHSTSGGHTAGGTFPAVPDPHDSISPRHTWKLTVDVSKLESQYGKGGRLTEVEVVKRNGLGADGGRVVTARLRFSNGTTADVSGNAVRSLTGLYSDWFTPVCGPEVRYVNAVYDLFLGRTPSGAEAEAGCAQARRDERFTLTTGLSRSDEWAGRQISELYQKVFGRPADAGGRSYWLGQVQRGMRIEQIAAQFYGSEEYYNGVGRTPEGYVDELYRDLMGRESDASGRSHWVDQLRSGRLNRTQVAGSFYSSLESRRDRVDALYLQVLDRAADSGGREFWVEELLRVGDVALAAHLAASDEYYSRSLSG